MVDKTQGKNLGHVCGGTFQREGWIGDTPEYDAGVLYVCDKCGEERLDWQF